MNEKIKSLDWTLKEPMHKRGAYQSSSPLSLETYGFLKTAYPYSFSLHMMFTAPRPSQIPSQVIGSYMDGLEYPAEYGLDDLGSFLDEDLEDFTEDIIYTEKPQAKAKKAKKKK
ncbi:MAG: hypothetical protein PHI83_00140 [Sphaerochaetaceae bacterium]|jgi:hypothetical protein|nr:hypothetical protein [Sphaerochaetaceae bacterium]